MEKKKVGRPPIGSKSSPPKRKMLPKEFLAKVEIEPFEHSPLPPAPLNVATPKKPGKLALANQSLLSVAFQRCRPGWRNYIQYVDMAARKGNEAMQRYRTAYESLSPKDRAGAWPEQICDLAQVEPGELYGAVCREMWDFKAAESSMMCSIEHPEVLGAMIKYAKQEDHYHDRELFLRATGSLPDKKGASINIFNQAAGVAAAMPDLSQPRAKLRSFDEEVIEMSRDLEVSDAPFVRHENVPPEDH